MSVWLVAVAVWRFGKVESRWERRLRSEQAAADQLSGSLSLEELAALLLPRAMSELPGSRPGAAGSESGAST